jgi:3-hydroxyisobutyrate dehydrogenase/2-hydroxy-3-oxopropionate reductase
MGSAIAANLMQAGYPVVGFDILARRRQDHRRAGGQVAKDARDLGTRADIVVCSLPSADALQEVARSPRPPRSSSKPARCRSP